MFNTMKIALCASITFTVEIKNVKENLEKMGHEVEIPFTASRILQGEIDLEKFLEDKAKNGDSKFRESVAQKSFADPIKRYFKIIKNSDAILVLNFDKNNIADYIGGNTFLEMGFAYVLDKPIYLYNAIPEMLYNDELEAMKPIVINHNLNMIK